MTDAAAPFANLFPATDETEWRKRVDAVLKGADFTRKLVSRTHDGIAIQPLYGRRTDAAVVTGARAAKPWRVMARVDHPGADDAARLAREDLEGGADALALVFPGSRSARGYGLPSSTVADLDAALAGVHPELISIRLDPAPSGYQNALTVAALVEHRRLNPVQMAIDFGLDPIGFLTTSGSLPRDWAAETARLGETVGALRDRGFRGPFLTVDIRAYHEAGGSEAQELGAALAQGVLYLRALEAGGLALADAFRAISFVIPVDGDQFLGIARLRAFRKLWSRVAEACGQVPEPAVIHAETSWRMLTKRDPHVNILRATVAAFAAGIGGADSVTVLPFTQALGLPDAAARRLARNTSIVLMEESGLWRVADPAAGSGGYEALTDELAARSWALFQEIEAEGGLLASLTGGKLQMRIAETAKARAMAIATRREPITGTSEFANLAETMPSVLDIPPAVEQETSSGHQATSGQTMAPVLVSRRISEPFEALRDRADAVLAQTGSRPQVSLVTIGPLADHAARLAFTRNVFEAGGFEITEGAMLACIVGSDAAYAESAPAVARDLSSSGRTVWLAGKPGELEDVLLQAGISRFVFAGCDVLDALTAALEEK